MSYIVNGKGPAGWRIDKLSDSEDESQALGLDFLKSYVAFVREKPVADQIVALLNEAEDTSPPAPTDDQKALRAAALEVPPWVANLIEGVRDVLMEAGNGVLTQDGKGIVEYLCGDCQRNQKTGVHEKGCIWGMLSASLDEAETARDLAIAGSPAQRAHNSISNSAIEKPEQKQLGKEGVGAAPEGAGVNDRSLAHAFDPECRVCGGQKDAPDHLPPLPAKPKRSDGWDGQPEALAAYLRGAPPVMAAPSIHEEPKSPIVEPKVASQKEGDAPTKKIDALTGRVVTYLGPLDERQTFPRDVPADVGRALQQAIAEADRQRAEVLRLTKERDEWKGRADHNETVALADAYEFERRARAEAKALREALAGLLSVVRGSPGALATVDAVLTADRALALPNPSAEKLTPGPRE